MVLLRLYVRIFQTRSAGIDDWLALIAIPPAIALTATVSLAASHYGWSQHIWDFQYPGVDPGKLIGERAISWASQMLYVWSSSLTKLSILYFYRRIFTSTYMRRIVVSTICFVLVYFMACFLMLLLECRPLSLYWHMLVLPQGTGGTCVNEGDLIVPAGIVNALIDLVILIIPLRSVLRLRLRWSQKLQVLAVFMAGALVCASSAIRVAATWTTIEETYDVTWAGYLVWMWIGIEVDVGLICASVPACKTLFKSWRQKIGTVRGPSNRQPSFPERLGQNSMLTSIAGSYYKILSREERDGDASSERVDRSSSIRSPTWPRRHEQFPLSELNDDKIQVVRTYSISKEQIIPSASKALTR